MRKVDRVTDIHSTQDRLGLSGPQLGVGSPTRPSYFVVTEEVRRGAQDSVGCWGVVTMLEVWYESPLVSCSSVLLDFNLQFAARMAGAGGSQGDLRFGPL